VLGVAELVRMHKGNLSFMIRYGPLHLVYY
jgi:hypothetical protein